MEEKLIQKIYKTYWKFIKETYSSLPDFYSITEEEFNKCKTIFHIPKVGKFYTTYKDVEKLNKYRNDRKNRNKQIEKNQTDV